jgi:hypothetical protein
MRIGVYTNLFVVLSVPRVAVVHLDAAVAIEEKPIASKHAAAVGRVLMNTAISCACDEASERLDGAIVLEPCIVFLRERLDR